MVCWRITYSGVEEIDCIGHLLKIEDQNEAIRMQNGAKREPTWSQKRAKVSQGTFKDTPCGTGSKKERNVETQ